MSNTQQTPFGDDRGKGDVARDHASDLKDHAVDAGQDLGQQTKHEVRGVARDAKSEARGLMDTVMGEANRQMSGGQNKLAESVRAIADELSEMANGSQRGGQASQIARTISSSGQDVARWLETNEPGDAVDSVRRYAARNPWTFLAAAAGAGLLVGRFARGFQAEASDNDPRGYYGQRDYRSTGYDTRGFAGQGTYDREGFSSYGRSDEERYGRPTGDYGQAGYTQTGTGYPQTGTGYPQAGVGRPDATATTTSDEYGRAMGFDANEEQRPGYQAGPGSQGAAWHERGDAGYDGGDRR